MKKIIVALIFITTFNMGYSQSGVKNNEIKLNIANTIAIASVEFGYERFIDEHQSLEGVILINDRMNYHSEKGSRKFDTNSFKLGYNYYFGEEYAASGLFINPFLKYRTGEFTQSGEDVDEPAFVGSTVTDMNSFIIGLGAGYKWNFNDTFVLGPFLNIGRNFSDEVKDRFSAIEFNAGFNIGYRF
ncbi:autotransporter outer membrane beta-barrel domain-containing protein [Christiangramia echinicola]|uniref:Outer membrane autotransporter barrel domain-containing protein n=1 Tax=Christiangramia echinicola TaxID=279359 RepID=A0A1H1MQX3_9FLAO|nr:autotransporter outer membrane beta-barrel domain-containing protein [Christiangramia echinicola]SDR89137.1 outer membrane autotransporter barrel domain-containing protein [Christiangramia echinicola]